MLFRAFSAAVSAFLFAGGANATVLTFDDYTTQPKQGIVTLYHGFDFVGGTAEQPSAFLPQSQGLANGIVSGSYLDAVDTIQYLLYNPAGKSVSTFTFNSAYFSGVNDGTHVEVFGFTPSFNAVTESFIAGAHGATLETFNWIGMYEILIQASYQGYGTTFGIDDMRLNEPVPEPSSFAMFIAGVGTLVGVNREQRRRLRIGCISSPPA